MLVDSSQNDTGSKKEGWMREGKLGFCFGEIPVESQTPF